MSIDEITTFRAARPEVLPYDPQAKARLRLRLLEGPPAPRRPPVSGRRRLLTAGALTGALAVGVAAVRSIEPDGGPGGTGGPIVLGPVSNAERLAGKAAERAATQPETTPRPDQWSYVKTVFAQTEEGGGAPLFGTPKRKHGSEIWRRVDGKKFAVIEGGTLKVVSGDKGAGGGYPYLMALPRDPAALLAHVYRQVDAEPAPNPAAGEAAKRKGPSAAPPVHVKPTEEKRNARAFELIEQYMRDAALPARLRAALYGALAKIPGVRYEPRAADIVKRPGVTLYREMEGYLRGEVLINPRTYEYLGFRYIAFRDLAPDDDHVLPAKKGQIIGWGGLLRAAIVDKPGRRS